ncbi:prokaryotic type I DNA topoisomerase, partial [Backusella circina FSU 941]
MKVLCVAEKPSAAKKIAELLSQNSFRTLNTSDVYCKNYCFNYNLNNRATSFCMTSLRGHILQIDFAEPSSRSWDMFPIANLFDIALEKKANADGEGIIENLRNQARDADILFIWTDCDREGEAIGGEVVEICHSVKPSLPVWRARFSSMIADQIHRAAQNHETLDDRQVEAVNARTELDLRVGAAFTRLQTLRLRQILSGGQSSRKIISYGSCQFPTLGFVVSRYLLIERFVPEAFWKIQMSYNQPQTPQQIAEQEQEIKTSFTWRRNHLFNRWACLIFLEKCIEAKVAKVIKVKSKQTQKWKPLPLTTVEMQKVGCRVLNMSSDEIMRVAEELYTNGLISYPRTETDQYDRNFEFMPLIDHLRNDPNYGQTAQLLHNGEFERPRNGKHNDKAHPPIHPTSYRPNLAGNQRRVYDFIARRFLGCCWKNAKGFETIVEVDMGGELFDAKGLVVLERNYLEVYIYDRWNGNYIPEFQEGDEFIPSEINMVEGSTTAPNLLTEPDLIGLMEKNEIGTDATIAEHIQKIIDREYVFKQGRYFRPSTLGIALVLGYDEIGFESSLSQPFLRREMEADLKRICEGTRTRGDVLQESIGKYRDMFLKSDSEFNKMITSVRE